MTTRSVLLPDDFTQLDEFFRLCEAASTIDLDIHRQALQDPHNKDQFLISLDESNQVQGFARLHLGKADNTTEGRYWYYLSPTTPSADLADSFLRWAEHATREQHAQSTHDRCRIFTGARADHPKRISFLETNAFTCERYFFTMSQTLHDDLPVQSLPDGYTLRNATLADVEEYVTLHNIAFQEHWNSPPMTVDELREEMQADDYRPEIDLLAIAPDGTLASFCTANIITSRRTGTEEVAGFISSLGTLPAHRGRGLGRALLLHNLRILYSLGMNKAYISVDADNVTGALRLYESVGFQAFETWLTYFKYL